MAEATRREEPPDKDAGRQTPGTKRETWREGGAGIPQTQGETGGAAEAPGRRWLPSALAGRYRVVQEFPARGAEADAVLVEDATGGRFFAKIYRRGIAPKSEVLERISRSAHEHVIELVEHGQSDGSWYELLEYAPAGTLRALLDQEGPQLGSSRVETILRELTDALAHIHELYIEHRDLKPENVLVRSREPLDLALTDFGIASTMDASLRFTSAHRTIRYAPPEALTGAVYQTRWDYWSLGILLVELLTGRHPFEGLSEQVVNSRLATMATDQLVDGVTDAGWRTLCRGLLRRDPQKRWSKAEIDKWRNPATRTTLVVAEETAPGRTGFPFLGRDYHTKEALAQAFAKNRGDAANIWRSRNQQLRDWLRHDLGLGKIAERLEEIDKAKNRDLNAQLLLVIVALDPTEERLTELANRAPSNRQDGEALRALFSSRILPAADELSGTSRFVVIETGWREAVAEYERLRQQLARQGVNVSASALDDERQTVLLAATTPGSAVSEGLRARARQVATPEARECPWFDALGDPDRTPPPALLLMPLVAGAAEEHTRARRRQAAAQRHLELAPLQPPVFTPPKQRQSNKWLFFLILILGLGVLGWLVSVKNSSRATARLLAAVPAPHTSCDNEATTRSSGTGRKTRYTITNRTIAPLTVYWLSYQGERKQWFVVQPYRTSEQETATTHSWLVADPSGRCLRIFNAPAAIVIETGGEEGGTLMPTTPLMPKLSKDSVQLRFTNVDDIGRAFVNGNKVAEVICVENTCTNDTGWVDVGCLKVASGVRFSCPGFGPR